MGYELVMTPEHRLGYSTPMATMSGGKFGTYDQQDKVAIKLGGPANLRIQAQSLYDVHRDHFNARNRPLPTTVSKELALLLGYITGDGTFQHDYIGMVVSNKDEDVAEHLAGICKFLLGYEVRRYSYRGVIELRIFSKQIKEWLQRNGSAKEHVPGFLWTAPMEIVTAYLMGLFEADGSVQPTSTGRVSFSTVHEQLAREVQELLTATGIAARRFKVEHGKGCGFIWIVVIPAAWKRHFQERVGFLSSRKKEILAGIVAISGRGNGHGSIPNMAEKAGHILRTEALPKRVASILHNVHARNTHLSTNTALLLRDEHPGVYSYLGLENFIRQSLLFDTVAVVESSGSHRVYDLTVEGTSTYIAGGFINHNCDYSQCIGKDSWVATQDGWVRIQDHPDAISKGLADTVILTTQRKYQLECTPDHRILTHRGWVEASKLQEGDWVALGGDAGWQPEPLNERQWLMGFWVGDGCYNRADTVAYFSQGSGASKDELRQYLTDTLGESPTESGDSFGVKGQRDFVTATRVFNKKDLRLPLDTITHLPSFLCGLFDADGTVDRNGVSFSTRFIDLAKDLQMALLRFGVMSTIVSSLAGRNFIPEGRIQYQVRISDTVSLENFARRIGFRLTDKADRLSQTLLTKTTRDQGNYLPISAQAIRHTGLPYKKYVFNHIHGRPYTRVKLRDVSSVELDTYKRYHWDRVQSVVQAIAASKCSI
jgi:intein/homing endonuclease